MKSMRRLTVFTGFAFLLAASWCSVARAQGPSAGSHAGSTDAGVGCGYYPSGAPATPAHPQQPSKQAGHASLVLVSAQNEEEDSGALPIVGLWKVKFVSKGTPGIPDGTLIDSGYATWHSDGTEILNSGARPPMTGNFCMGVWKKTGSTYKLNHYGLSWDPTGTTFIGPGNIREEVVVGKGENSYSGCFTIDQYDTDGNLLAHVSGEVTAERVTVD
jgi:hypothetical protein